ncbi:MAG: TonB-dependent receptor [Bacteroidetes bacterium]|nr:TonB-dependent receptor [Bacteroidota bacterium]
MITKRLGQFILAALIAAISSPVFAQTGKIAGKITDQQSGEELIGASVLVVGTSLGAATDFEGNYNILNVPPGVYTLRVSYVGYSSKTISNVRVSIGLTARIDVQLSAEVLALEGEILITAERPLVQKDLTASTAIVSGDQISALPVTELAQVVSLQAGNVNGHFRGGRTGEVAYMIDGVPVTDKFDGSAVVDVNKNIVSELQVISGAFNAEYGQAMSAVINVATKDGTNKYEGSATVYYGDYITGNDDIFPKEDYFNPFNIQNYEGTFSGPVPYTNNNLYFFAVGRFVNFGGHLYGKRKFNPDNFLAQDSLGRDAGFQSLGDNKYVAMNNSSRISGQMKLTWPVSTSIKTSVNYMYEDRQWKDYNRFYVYNPDAIRTNYQTSHTMISTLTHTLTASTFYTVSVSGFNKFFENYVYDGLSSKYVHPSLNNQVAPFTFSVGGVDMGQFQRESRSFSFKSDLWSQVNNEHQIKAGFEYKYHMIDFLSRTVLPVSSQENFAPTVGNSPYIQTRYDGNNTFNTDLYERSPQEFSAYIQDKVELDNFILNIGIRFDWFDAAGKVLNDPTDPSIYNPLKPINIYNDLNSDGKIDDSEFSDGNKKSVEAREKYWWKDTEAKYQISPRIGAAFPITDQGKIYFSYGHFYQFPNFDLLYRNANYKFGLGSGNQGVAGNSDLKPERNVSMEVGLNQQLTSDMALDATVYFRDYRDLSGTRADEIIMFGGTRQYSQLVNSDFAFIRGFILTLNQRMTDGLGVTLDYTYQIAKGTASNPDAARNAIAGGLEPEVKLVALDWDQTHTVNATVNYSQKDWGVSTIMTFGSGQPYTPRTSQDAATILTNSEIKPSNVNVDVRGYYNLGMPEGYGSMTIFARVYNLFDTLNEYGVFDDSGRSGFTVDQLNAERLNPDLKGVNTLDEWFTNPQNYSAPRLIEFGVTYNF